MPSLLALDLLKVFDNYEPSRTRVWKIVRSVHPDHCDALLYLLENVSKSRKTTALKLPTSENSDNDKERLAIDSVPTTDTVSKTAVKPALNLTHVTVTRQLRPVPQRENSYIYNLRDTSGNLTIIGLMHIVPDNMFELLTLEERVVMYNFRTAYYN